PRAVARSVLKHQLGMTSDKNPVSNVLHNYRQLMLQALSGPQTTAIYGRNSQGEATNDEYQQGGSDDEYRQGDSDGGGYVYEEFDGLDVDHNNIQMPDNGAPLPLLDPKNTELHGIFREENLAASSIQRLVEWHNRTYPYLEEHFKCYRLLIGSQLATLFTNSSFIKLLNNEELSIKNTFQGDTMQHLQNEEHLFEEKYDIGLSLYVDGFQSHKRGGTKLNLTMPQILNLPPEFRFNMDFLIDFAIVPNTKRLDSYLQ
ncbi:hypothetical protein V8B55DRAFT_1322215, partial [Mucor lusitanicus]